MPRPGPRPYECVRKAWHSDRHQPIRGSLIQEIFRVVNEIHSSSTRKNKEWQEKLPIVVLKAEEIMYSKANSEAEYMDLDTLLDRTNDAINTIIRRDETTESGELLQPCIEAALTLGCTPRRASRSQRNNSPRRYLGSNPRESPTDRHGIVEKSTLGNPAIISDSMPLNPCSSNFESMISAKLDHVPFFRAINPAIPVQTHPTANSISIYPFGSCPQAERSPSHFAPAHSQHNHEENFQNHPIDSVDVSKTFTLKRATYISQNSPQLDCDLSLRLGPHSAKDVNTQTCCQPREIEHGDPTAARDANTFGELRLGSDHHQFAFFRREDADHLSNRFSVKRSFGSEQLKVLDQSMRKKSAFCGFYFVEDQQCRWQPKHSLKHKDETKAKCRFVD